MTRLDLDEIDRDAAAERLRERDRHREPGPRRPRQDDRGFVARREFTAGLITAQNHASASIEVSCPIHGCGSIVYVPGDSHLERIDCTDCGARFLTRRGIDGVPALELEATGETLVVDDPDGPPPPLAAGAHLKAFDLGAVDEDGTEPADDEAPSDLFPLGGWQRRACDAINRGMEKTGNKPFPPARKP